MSFIFAFFALIALKFGVDMTDQSSVDMEGAGEDVEAAIEAATDHNWGLSLLIAGVVLAYFAGRFA